MDVDDMYDADTETASSPTKQKEGGMGRDLDKQGRQRIQKWTPEVF